MKKEWKEDKVVIALDPSGNFNEGKGTTGYAISNNGYVYSAGEIAAAEYKNQMEYWTAVIKKLRDLNKEYHGHLQVVCEDYRLYASASEAQINSNLETPQLIGAIKWFCHISGIPITMQMAAEVKDRWCDSVLKAKGLMKEDYYTHQKTVGQLVLGKHSIDAFRHLMHFNTFKVKTREVINNTHKTYQREYY